MLLDARVVSGRLDAYRPATVWVRAAPRTPAASSFARAVARLRSRALDRALVEGADPAASPQLAAHAARITAAASRRELADVLDRLARSARARRSRLRVSPWRAAIRSNAGELHALAALLRGSSAVQPRGVARLRTLVSDGIGPLYTDRDGGALACALDSARELISVRARCETSPSSSCRRRP